MLIKEHISLKDFTTLGRGGKARYFIFIYTIEDLEEAVSFAKEKRLPFFVLGEGSNVLFPDDGFSGVVIKNELLGILYKDHGDSIIEAMISSGVCFDDFISDTISKNIYGLENLSGIPGTVGATPVQNVGAYGTEISDVIKSVFVFDTEKIKHIEFTKDECEFGYRDSIFKKEKGKKYIITSVCFKLKDDGEINTSYNDIKKYFEKIGTEAKTVKDVRKAVLYIRARKFPDIKKAGTAGSFFKNVVASEEKALELSGKFHGMPYYKIAHDKYKIPLAWIFDNVCGLKGFTDGGVGLYEKQPLVLVCGVDATAKEIIIFANKIKKIVKEKTGLDIEKEVTVLTNNR